MSRPATSYGRFHAPESLRSLRRTLIAPDPSTFREVDSEPLVGVLDQEDLFAQGIDTSALVPGARKVDALGSCTANATTGALSSLLGKDAFLSLTGASDYSDTKAAEEWAIRFYHACSSQTGDPSQEWPPTDCGSSGPYIVSELQAQKIVASHLVAAPTAESIVGLLQGGCVLQGTPWLNAWEEPTPDGFIDGDGSASTLQAQIDQGVAGGHETVQSAVEKLVLTATDKVDAAKTVVRIRNSWSKSWGDNGSCRVHLSTLLAIAHQSDYRRLVAA